jgi:hypothetical protein
LHQTLFACDISFDFHQKIGFSTAFAQAREHLLLHGRRASEILHSLKCAMSACEERSIHRIGDTLFESWVGAQSAISFVCLRQRMRISSADSRTSVRRARVTRLPRGNTRLWTSHPAKPGRMAGTTGLLTQTKTKKTVFSPGFRRCILSCEDQARRGSIGIGDNRL